MFVIHGRYRKRRKHDSGDFHCPLCHRTRTYTAYTMLEVSHVFFIPMDKTVIGDFITCGGCKNRFDPDVIDSRRLGHVPPELIAQLRRVLEGGSSLADAQATLKQAGMATARIASLIDGVAGADVWECDCGQEYVDAVYACRHCGRSFAPD